MEDPATLIVIMLNQAEGQAPRSEPFSVKDHLYLGFGVCWITSGAWFLFYCFASLQMVNPYLKGWEYWSTIFGKLVGPDLGLGIILCSGLIGLGVVLFVSGMRAKPSWLAVAVAASMAVVVSFGGWLLFLA